MALANQRNRALDVMRGLTIALMIIVNTPGDWQNMFAFLHHAEWHGFLGADVVFPFFLFVAGYAAALKLKKSYSTTGPHCASALTLEEQSPPPFYLPLLRRSLILFAIGVFLNAWPFGFVPGSTFAVEKLRIFGVLQRIALCVFFGTLVLRAARSPMKLMIVMIGVAALYELLMRVFFITTADGHFGRSFALEDNFARYVDLSLLPSAMLYKVKGVAFDPEGIVTTLGALLSFLFGSLFYYRKQSPEAFRRPGGFSTDSPRYFLAFGCLAAGFAASLVEPINKNLWTLPYVLVTAGGAMLVFGLLEVFLLWKTIAIEKFTRPLESLGRNPLAVYVLSGVVAKALALWQLAPGQSLKAWLYSHLASVGMPAKISSLIYSILFLALMAFIASRLRRFVIVAR
ncbi:MAG: DUF1624 domain-containing protein [Spirochaetes bacterium]|nr:DUF1624 domain-containing protein [Spirochaetota bacterium]